MITNNHCVKPALRLKTRQIEWVPCTVGKKVNKDVLCPTIALTKWMDDIQL